MRHSVRGRKEGESVEKEREFVVVFPGEDNYGFAQKSFTVDAGDKECYVPKVEEIAAE